MITWPEIKFPPINLWSFPLDRRNKGMYNKDMSIETYKKVESETSSSLTLVIRSYEYIINELERMKEHGPDHPEYRLWRANAISKWLDLYNCLDFKQGVHVAQNLGNLYGYMMNVTVKDDTGEHVDEMISLMNTVLEGWKGVKK